MATRFVTADSVTGTLPAIVQSKIATDIQSDTSTIGAAVKSQVTAQVAADVATAVAAAPTVVAAAASAASTAVTAAVPSAVNAYLAAGSVGQVRTTGFAWYDGSAAAPDTYFALGGLGQDAGALAGNTGYTRQTTGVPVDQQAQSRVRRCVLKDDGTAVRYYLDCDNSAKVAGLYSGGVQTGWVRVHEGTNDPARPIVGQAATGNATLRAGIRAWSGSDTYNRGDRVLYNDRLWDCLSDANVGIVPAAGLVGADLTGTDGQVMVEIPRFYFLGEYDPTTGRNAFSVAFDTGAYQPFPDLTTADTAPASVVAAGRTHPVHPAFTMGGTQRRARYIAAYRAIAADTGNNGTGVLKSIADGTTTSTGTVSRTNFRTKARNRNGGLSDPSGQANNVWGLVGYQLWHAMQMLMLTEYRTFNLQAVLGGGNIGGSDYLRVCGRSNPIGNASGNYTAGSLVTPTASDTDGVAWRGMEDAWGSQWLWVDGWNVQNTAAGVTHYISGNPHQFADDTATNYTRIAGVSTSGQGAYAKTLLPGTVLPQELGGSTSTYLTDYWYSSTATSGWFAAFAGGAADDGAGAGAFALCVYGGAAGSTAGIGAALAR